MDDVAELGMEIRHPRQTARERLGPDRDRRARSADNRNGRRRPQGPRRKSSSPPPRRPPPPSHPALSATLAAVSTIYAANKVYTTFQDRNSRHEEIVEGHEKVARGEEDRVKARKKGMVRVQDVAAVAISGLYLTSCAKDWKEIHEGQKIKKEIEDKKRELRRKGIRDKDDRDIEREVRDKDRERWHRDRESNRDRGGGKDRDLRRRDR